MTDLTTEAASIAREDGRQRPDAGSEQITVVQAPADAGAKLSLTEAARALRSARKPPEQQQAGEQRPEATPPAVQESTVPGPRIKSGDDPGKADDAGEYQAPPGETESADPAAAATAELSPIEPPRSWTKEDKELFANLPRETQERLAERERSRDSDLSQRQQKATEQAKALEAERLQAERTRQQYENALPLLEQNLQAVMAGEFGDVKSWDDVQRMAAEDWPRYVRWNAAQQRLTAVQQEVRAAQERQSSEQQQRWSDFARRQAELFAEKVPDMADAKKAAELRDKAISVLKDIGFTDDELSASYDGKLGLSVRDHRVQLLVRDAVLWREAQAKAKAAATRPVPPVQRPGTSQGKGAEAQAQISNLTQRLDKSGSLKDAAALLRAKRAAAR